MIDCACGCGEKIPARSWGRARTFARGHNGRMGTRLGKEGRNTVRAATSPTLGDLQWAAGFIEGEGHFQPNRKSGSAHAVQKDPEPILKLQSLFGGTVSSRSVVTRGARRSYWHWDVSGARARGFMMTIFGLMTKRRQGQIRVALGVS